MLKLLERLKTSLMKKQNKDEGAAIAIATSILEKNGYMKDGKLTAKGVIKSRLPEGTKGLGKITALKNKLKKSHGNK